MSFEPVAAFPARLPSAGAHGEVVSLKREELEEGLKAARAMGAKTAAENERKAGKRALEALTAAHDAELERLGLETVNRERAAYAHGFHKAGWIAGLAGIVAGVLGMLGVQEAVWRTAARSTESNVVTGAMIERMRDRAGVAPEPVLTEPER